MIVDVYGSAGSLPKDSIPEELVVKVFWQQEDETRYQAWAKENAQGIFPPTRQLYISSLLASNGGEARDDLLPDLD